MGEREVRVALRKTLFKYCVHQDQDLFDRANGRASTTTPWGRSTKLAWCERQTSRKLAAPNGAKGKDSSCHTRFSRVWSSASP